VTGEEPGKIEGRRKHRKITKQQRAAAVRKKDRHPPGYMAEYMKKRRAKLKDKPE
jgi:hypothetical protein